MGFMYKKKSIILKKVNYNQILWIIRDLKFSKTIDYNGLSINYVVQTCHDNRLKRTF